MFSSISTILVPGIQHSDSLFPTCFKMITTISPAVIWHHTKDINVTDDTPHYTFHSCATHLFCKWKSIPLYLPHLLLPDSNPGENALDVPTHHLKVSLVGEPGSQLLTGVRIYTVWKFKALIIQTGLTPSCGIILTSLTSLNCWTGTDNKPGYLHSQQQNRNS